MHILFNVLHILLSVFINVSCGWTQGIHNYDTFESQCYTTRKSPCMSCQAEAVPRNKIDKCQEVHHRSFLLEMEGYN